VTRNRSPFRGHFDILDFRLNNTRSFRRSIIQKDRLRIQASRQFESQPDNIESQQKQNAKITVRYRAANRSRAVFIIIQFSNDNAIIV
jgi:hypothetical protein